MSESSMRQKVCKALKSLDAVAVENPIRSGTPDVNFIGGWLELKWLRSWPKEEITIVSLPHYTQIQRRWAQRRFERGGYCGLLLQVGREWMLFKPPYSTTRVGRVNRDHLMRHCDLYHPKGLDYKDLRQHLRSVTDE